MLSSSKTRLLFACSRLSVVRIEALHQTPDDSGGGSRKRGGGSQKRRQDSDDSDCGFTFASRWYCLPEETRSGRQVGTFKAWWP